MEQTEINNLQTIQDFWNKRPWVIAGPCSAETEEQVIRIAQQLKATGKVDVLRAGIWKPRTRPGNFEGVGSKGLPWLQKAKQLTGLPFAIEVATAKQLEDALKHDTDIIWIGARTTANPFSVQEMADAFTGLQLPVLIKNPVNPDLELWTGAVERVLKSGIEKVALVHRGFSSYGDTEFRNAPMWQLALEMKRRFPDLPFIIDPSHICGNRHMLQSVTQNAIDLDYDGLIIESHITPDEAWSDAKQQITPEKLDELLNAIVWRKERVESPLIHEELEKLRRQIDRLDDELLQLLYHRMKVSEEIGFYKKEHDITILQTERWNQILERVCRNGALAGLSEEFIKRYFDAIHLESIKHQDAVMNKK
ncbi:3-deoxy-7-phosphoheptulonate synthase [Taibaiella lutea]|uniref:chorismate mutase n=1 Tax=Taibaiella lutea TaxID=2608001 RepID=A0A5M6CL81_9BACT|nr:chorismate mutase [Taibaiella lutea]KAA5534742.1 3-deoxy-7-phosphoheptulonate synthase [Taibaiella lutea]